MAAQSSTSTSFIDSNSQKTTHSNSILYPPGGLVVWFFIIIELATYAVATVVFVAHRSTNPEAFTLAQSHLDPLLGTINTFLLITSGYLVAQAVAKYKAAEIRKSSNLLFLGSFFGIGFLGVKIFEYRSKWLSGHEVGDGGFFDYYWGLTGFHFIHVLLGVFILIAMAIQLRKGLKFEDEDAGIEAGAAFWHMCDLIWIVLFPLFYLLK